MRPEICISDKIPGDADDANPETMLEEPLPWGLPPCLRWVWVTLPLLDLSEVTLRESCT